MAVNQIPACEARNSPSSDSKRGNVKSYCREASAHPGLFWLLGAAGAVAAAAALPLRCSGAVYLTLTRDGAMGAVLSAGAVARVATACRVGPVRQTLSLDTNYVP